MRSCLTRTNTVLGSRRFFWAILIFFVFEALWIALSAIYPMPFDEDFHFGLIKIYSHYWLPFLGSQPASAAAYGAVARDPSYVYHYLLSFPYRAVALLVHGQTSQVIVLRLINIALFSSGLVLFRRVLQRARVSDALTNLMLLLFVLIPIVPQLAGQINYDNLLFPLVAWVCLLTFQITDELRRQRPTARTLLLLLAVCLFTSLVKYAFLPIFLGVLVFLGLITYQQYRGHLRLVVAHVWANSRQQSRLGTVALTAIFIIGLGMFIQRDVVNVIDYHTLVPDCGQVLSVKSCSAYPVWYYTYTNHQKVVASRQQQPHTITYINPVVYTGVWVYWMWYRLFFAVNGPVSGYANYPPLPLPSAAAALIVLSGVGSVFVWRRHVFHDNPYLLFFFIISLAYIVALLIDGYTNYRRTDILQTMNGRYLLPILPLVGAILGRGFSLGLHRLPVRKTALALIVLLFFLEGGGFLTFVTRSDASWDWPNSPAVKVNNAARTVTKPLIIKGSKTYSTPAWFFN